jgi:hypothetical protein
VTITLELAEASDAQGDIPSALSFYRSIVGMPLSHSPQFAALLEQVQMRIQELESFHGNSAPISRTSSFSEVDRAGRPRRVRIDGIDYRPQEDLTASIVRWRPDQVRVCRSNFVLNGDFYQVRTIEGQAFSVRFQCGILLLPSTLSSLSAYCFTRIESPYCVAFDKSSVALSELCERSCYDTTLVNFSVPPQVKSLGKRCFARCPALFAFDFGVNRLITKLPICCLAFGNLQMIKIPSTVTVIENQCFTWCRALSVIEFEKPAQVSVIGECAFSYSGIPFIEIPSSVESLGQFAFFSTRRLEELHSQNQVRSLN